MNGLKLGQPYKLIPSICTSEAKLGAHYEQPSSCTVTTYSLSQLSVHHEVVHMFFCFGKF